VAGNRRGKETLYSLADEHVAHIALDAFTHGSEAGHRARPLPDQTREEHEDEHRP
jgi:hypothetical protein